MSTDDHYMSRALELAGQPAVTSPNPRVGAVVVRDGVVISEGTHVGAGSAHAEAVALTGVDAAGATLYVNLEPCTHEGRTPPCAPMVADSGIARIVVAMEDPDPRVAGRGIALLTERGIDVTVGVGAAEATVLNAAYLHHRTTGRPLVTLKLALSLDGKLAAADGSSQWITGEDSRLRVHARRLESDAILIGAGTVLADDPSLTVRDVAAPRQPARVAIDARGRIPATSRFFGPGETIVFTTIGCPHSVKTGWKEAGAEVLLVSQNAAGDTDLNEVLENLGGRGWLEVYCEGGARLATSLIAGDLVDRLELYYGPLLLGGSGLGLGDIGLAGIDQAARWNPRTVERVGDDALVIVEKAEL